MSARPLAVAVLFFAASVPAAEPRRDLFGDELPPGAVARLGSRDFRVVDRVHAAAFSPDGKLLAMAGSDPFVSSVHIWDLAAGKKLPFVQRYHNATAGELAFSADGAILAVSVEKYLDVWAVAQNKRLHSAPLPDESAAFALVPSGKQVVTAGDPNDPSDHALLLWDLDSRKVIRKFEGHRARVRGVVVSADGKQLVSWNEEIPGDREGAATVCLWRLSDGKLQRQWKLGCRQVVFAEGGRPLALRQHCGQAMVVDLLKDQVVLYANRQLEHALLSPGGRLWFSQEQGTMKAEVIGTRQEVRKINADAKEVLASSHEGNLLAFTGKEKWRSHLHVWDIRRGREVRLMGDDSGRPTSVAFRRDGAQLVTGAAEGWIQIWDAESGRLLQQWRAHREVVGSVAWSPGGQIIASGCTDRSARLWDVATRKELQRFKDLGGQVQMVAFTPNGRRLIAATSGGGIHIWDSETFDSSQCYRVFEHAMTGVAITSDGRTMVAAGSDQYPVRADGEVRLWRLGAGRRPIRIAPHRDRGENKADVRPSAVRIIECVTFSPDGRFIATAEKDYLGNDRRRIIVIRETASAKVVLVIDALGEPACPQIQATSRLVILGPANSIRGELRRFCLITGRELVPWKGHRRDVFGMALSADCSRLASACLEGCTLLWNTVSDVQILPDLLADLPPRKNADVWQDLVGDDAAAGYQAIWRLAANPKGALPFLRRMLRPATAVDQERITELIRDLDSKKFTVREKASEELVRLGEQAEMALLQTLEAKPSLEVRRRVEAVVDRIDRSPPPERLWMSRAVMVLEQIADADAKRLLEDLAKGASDAWLTREAKGALGRMK